MGSASKFLCASIFALSVVPFVHSAIDISVNAQKGVKKISPYLFGRNIDVIDEKVDSLSSKEIDYMNQIVEAGLHMIRANHGNNATRYNFRKKFSVHPNWFNNVNSQSWDISAKKILENMPGVDAMYAFQLAGYVAKTQEYNFKDWDWYLAHNNTWPSNRDLNIAGGGIISDDGKTAIKEGDPTLYNQEWPADSSVAIIPYWRDSLKFDMNRLRYWSMDNETDIWRYTHDDLNLPVTGEFLVERYVEVAKKARAQWKDIKLTGPVSAGEWDWVVLRDIVEGQNLITGSDGKKYSWLEYFIKRVSEEQKKSGVRLLDMFDIHWYPQEKDYESRMNWHRVLFDTTYNYPGANGIRFLNEQYYYASNQTKEQYDETYNKEYILKRVNDWLEKYFGKDHGITLGISETSLKDENAMVTALIYASFLGTMMNHGVEFFTPWSWDAGMYEVAHLFSCIGKEYRVESISSNDSLVSAYASINQTADSMTVIFVNRAESETQNVNLTIDEFALDDGEYETRSLSGLNGETFVSRSSNALKKGSASLAQNKLSMTLPAKSITALILSGAGSEVVESSSSNNAESSSSTESNAIQTVLNTRAFISSENESWTIHNFSDRNLNVAIFDCLGNQVLNVNAPVGSSLLNLEHLKSGHYVVKFKNSKHQGVQKIIVKTSRR